ncbi:MAG TPA: peptidylprolyl isomerase [Planctomycetaceae bacterium]|nr:peptidylprolyl isomerase [Planctomycetaceae bacterium]
MKNFSLVLAGCLGGAWLSGAAPVDAAPGPPDSPAGRVIVTVNGRPITAGVLDVLMVSRRVPEDVRPRVRRRFVEQLVDRRLMQSFLADRKAAASPLELDAEVRRIRELIHKSGETPEAVLARLGYTEQTLREELALPLAWRAYTRLLITPQRLREYFAAHRRRFDGTEIRASQVFLKAGSDAERAAALERLRVLRDEIAAGNRSFADAAREHSAAPSAAAGGDVGWFPFRGRMPGEFSRVAFGLKAGEVSEPFVTAFGVHLATVTGEKPGDLSLEDVRRDVFAALSEELWDQIVAEQRASAKIEWRIELDDAAALDDASPNEPR